MIPLCGDISPGRVTPAAYRNIQYNTYNFHFVSTYDIRSVLSCRYVLVSVSAWRDIPSGRDDLLHVNKKRRDVTLSRDEIDDTTHAIMIDVLLGLSMVISET